MKGMNVIALGCALLTAGAAPSAAVSATYRWVDERGVVNYGNAPPAAGRDVRVALSKAFEGGWTLTGAYTRGWAAPTSTTNTPPARWIPPATRRCPTR